MKYIKNLVLVLCFVFPSVIWAETQTQNCSVMSNVEIGKKYPIVGLPNELSGKLNDCHLTVAFNHEGEKIIFYETDIIHSVLLPVLLPQIIPTWNVSFSDETFVVDSAYRFLMRERILFFMIVMVISVIFSGFTKNNLSLSKRPAVISILVGALVGALSGSLLIGAFAGAFTGGLSANSLLISGIAGGLSANSLVISGIAGGFAGGFAGALSGAFIMSYGLAAAITKE